MHVLNWRYFALLVILGLGLIALCIFMAIALFSQHRSSNLILRENVSSKRVAVELEECLTDLIALENDQVERVSVLHERISVLLDQLSLVADQESEQEIKSRLDEQYQIYLNRWNQLPPISNAEHEQKRKEVTQFLDSSVRKVCDEFIQYNDRRIEESVANEEKVLRRLAWGLALVGVLGGVAGIVLGYAVARTVAVSIRKLQVQIRHVAGKMSAESPSIVLTGEGDFTSLHQEMDQLSRQITEVLETLQQREREILRSEQLAAVGQLAAGVAHEIRNPLTSIKLMVQTTLENENNTLSREDLLLFEGEIRRIESSLQIFLDFTRPQKANRQQTDLKSLVEEVKGLIRGRAVKQKVQVHSQLPETEVLVIADREQFRQVLVNLCLNSLDAMPQSGELTLILESIPKKGIELRVRDTGPGIVPSILPRLFEPFVSGKDTGLGLGLAISKRIVEEHGGKIIVTNLQPTGTEFVVQIPQNLQDDPSDARLPREKSL